MKQPPLTFLLFFNQPLEQRLPWLLGTIQLLRPLSCTVATIFAFFGIYLSQGEDLVRIIIAITIIWLSAAFGFAINDFYDVETDTYGKPHRPIPAGRLSIQAVLWIAITLAVTVICLSMFLGFSLFLLTLLGLFLCWAYSARLKNTVILGNATIALLDVLGILYCALAVSQPNEPVYVLCGLVFIYIIAQEILHTSADIQGDSQAGLTTIATVLGQNLAIRVFQTLMFMFMLVTLIPFVTAIVSPLYLYTLIPCSLLPLSVVLIILTWKISDRTIYISQWLTKIVWFSSIIPVLYLDK